MAVLLLPLLLVFFTRGPQWAADKAGEGTRSTDGFHLDAGTHCAYISVKNTQFQDSEGAFSFVIQAIEHGRLGGDDVLPARMRHELNFKAKPVGEHLLARGSLRKDGAGGGGAGSGAWSRVNVTGAGSMGFFGVWLEVLQPGRFYLDVSAPGAWHVRIERTEKCRAMDDLPW